jgi:hypothetical protein
MVNSRRHRVSRILARVFPALVVVAFAGSGRARADQTWTLLPQSSWTDQFSPLWIDEDGGLCEGDPSLIDVQRPIEIITHYSEDPETGETIATPAVENQVLVNFLPTATPTQIQEAFATLGVEIFSAWYQPNPEDLDTSVSWFALRILPTSPYFNNVGGIISAFLARPDVEFAEHNLLLSMEQDFPAGAIDPRDIYWANPYDSTFNQLDLKTNLGARPAWTITTGDHTETGASTEVVAVVMDSGVQLEHPDLEGNVWKCNGLRQACFITTEGPDVMAPRSGSNSNSYALMKAASFDENYANSNGHGTAMAGIIAARTDNPVPSGTYPATYPDPTGRGRAIGVAGCAPNLKFMSMRLHMAAENSFTTDGVARAIKRLNANYADDEVKVVNMSFSVLESPKSIRKAIKKDLYLNWTEKTTNHNRLYVAAAGATGRQHKSYPAAWGDIVLGVTGAVHYDSGLQDRGFNFTPPNYVANDYSIHINGTSFFTKVVNNVRVPDLDVYGVSAYWNWGATTDRTGTDGYSRKDSSGEAHKSGVTDYYWYQGVNNRWNYLTTSLDPRQWFPGGNSNAAAQVSGLAGLLFAKKGRAVDWTLVKSHIKSTVYRHLKSDPSQGKEDYTHGIEFVQSAINSQTPVQHGFIPYVVDFYVAVSTF